MDGRKMNPEGILKRKYVDVFIVFSAVMVLGLVLVISAAAQPDFMTGPGDLSSEGAATNLDNLNQPPKLISLAPDKPVLVCEFGATAHSPLVAADRWAREALNDILSRRWGNVVGFSWWNERWQNDRNPNHDTDMRVQGTAALGNVFRSELEANMQKLLRSAIAKGPTPSPDPPTATAS